jgi:hypothetical protein
MIGIIPDPIRRPLSTQTVHSGVRVPEADIPLRTTIVGDDEADSGLASDFITSSDKPGRNAERIKCTSRSINQVIEDPYVVSAISIPNVDAQLFEVLYGLFSVAIFRPIMRVYLHALALIPGKLFCKTFAWESMKLLNSESWKAD